MKNLKECINVLSREQIQSLLESNGMAVYDTESTEDLEETLLQCTEDGNFEEDEIRSMAE